MRRFLVIFIGALLLIAIVLVGSAYYRSMTTKKSLTNGNGITPAKTIEGDWLAGNKSFYFVFNQDDYQRALDGRKIIFLSFYANWCPFCRAEEPELQKAFNLLESDQLIGFRVNYNDSDTSPEEKALAQNFRVTYQHTKVILKDGKEIFRTGDTWTKEDFAREINKILAQ